jgi:hypothetical protein
MQLEPIGSFTLHTKIIKDSLTLLTKVNIHTNLALDSDNHMYIESLLTKLPEMLEAMGQARGLSAGAAAKKKLSEAEINRLITLSGTINPQFEDLRKGLLDFVDR